MGMTRPTCTNCGATTFTTSLRISTATEDRAHRKRLHWKVSITRWSTRTTNHVDVWIKNIMYLYIDEQEIVMNNISTYLTGFQSSSDNVEIQNLKVFVEGVETSTAGVSVTREPFVHNGSITINSTIPDNFRAENHHF